MTEAPLVDAPASEFDLATAVRSTDQPGTYAIDVDAGFTVGPKPNGGYLLATAARATGAALAQAGTDHRDALAATAHYLHAPDPGPATVVVDVLRTGRSASQARAVIVQDGRHCVDVTLTMGTLPAPDAAPSVAWSALAPPEVAPIEDCFLIPSEPPGAQFRVSIADRHALRLDPATLQWAAGTPSGRGELRGWIEFADGRPVDALSLLYFLDALPPATFDVARSGWVPTLSLTTYVRAVPVPGPLRITQRAQVIADGRVDEVCEVWDASGRLVANGTQLAAIRFDEATTLTPHPEPGHR